MSKVAEEEIKEIENYIKVERDEKKKQEQERLENEEEKKKKIKKNIVSISLKWSSVSPLCHLLPRAELPARKSSLFCRERGFDAICG